MLGILAALSIESLLTIAAEAAVATVSAKVASDIYEYFFDDDADKD